MVNFLGEEKCNKSAPPEKILAMPIVSLTWKVNPGVCWEQWYFAS